jgi:hypothetical protein
MYISLQVIAIICVVIGVLSCPIGMAVDSIFDRYY